MSPAGNLLITGYPGTGKTTMLVWLARALSDHNPSGFITREIREEGVRIGFLLISCSGLRRVLSHVNIKSSFHVGKYYIDIAGFEEFLKEIRWSEEGVGLVIVDEIGKMECYSPFFRDSVLRLLDANRPFIATIGKRGTPFMEGIKQRPDVKLLEVTLKNRESIRNKLLVEATAILK
jgi:nucleoside-triphosphatase